MLRTLAIAALFIFVTGCVTSTPYQPATGASGYGFSEQRIEENKYRITFRGNSSTTREQVENSLLYRAAELTAQNGYDHFIVVENDTEAKTTVSHSTNPAFFGRYPFGYPGSYYAFPYYAYGFGWEPYDDYERQYTRYSAVAFITMHKGAKPSDKPQAFDAREVMKNLEAAVRGTKPASY